MNRTEDRVTGRLAALCTAKGYTAYQMRKFEEYSLYLENKNFLSSEFAITFNDLNGKLLALKPDVTLSIVKNTKATEENSEKLFYRESVFRLDKQTHEYKEIDQFGLELLGRVDAFQTLEVCVLALQSLQAADEHFVLDISHMGFVTGLLEGAEDKARVLECIRSRNSHDLPAAAAGLNEKQTEALRTLTELNGPWVTALEKARALVCNENMAAAYRELEELFSGIPEEYRSRVRLDFSIVNDADYYNGILLRGYLEKLPRAVLSGGRYDLLCEKLGKSINAMGFAMYLNDLAYYNEMDDYDVDTLLLYRSGTPASRVLSEAEKLSRAGSVRTESTVPENLKYRRLVRLEEDAPC